MDHGWLLTTLPVYYGANVSTEHWKSQKLRHWSVRTKRGEGQLAENTGYGDSHVHTGCEHRMQRPCARHKYRLPLTK